MYSIDLNCDLGEGFGVYSLGQDARILEIATSANIACGFHAGDPSVMRQTVKIALEKRVGLGAHPGLPDLVGFGRRNMDISPQEAYDLVVYQVGALWAFIKAEGGKMQHVKPHGALYNMAVRNPSLAEAIAQAVYNIDPEIILFGLAGSALIEAGEKIGLRVANEVFADRTYQSDGTLTPRHHPNAFISDYQEALNQVGKFIKEKKVMSLQGTEVSLPAETICLHGDNPKALKLLYQIRHFLNDLGVKVANLQ